MGHDSDDMISLPSPPPPRPAARREAIEAALRKFDGISEPAAPKPRSRPWWASLNRRPAGALVAATLIAVVAIPAIQIALRDGPQREATESAPGSITAPEQGTRLPRVANEEPAGPATDQANAIETPTAPAQAAPAEPALAESKQAETMLDEERQRLAKSKDERNANIVARPSPVIAAPTPMPVIAPPPPPPPPPPPAARRADQQRVAEQEANEADALGSIVVTGSRVPSANKSEGFAQRAEAPPSQREIAAPYGAFLNRLQEALGDNDRRTVLRLVGLPLRVNFAGGARTYRTRQEVERDYDRIFTPAVREATQHFGSYDIVTRDGGRLRGSGRIWFGCGNRTCSSEETVRLREVTP